MLKRFVLVVLLMSATAIAKDKKDNQAMKTIENMLDAFKKMSDNRDQYLSSKINYAQYIKNDSELAKQASASIDFWDVCEKSLKYDYDVKTKKFTQDHWAGKSQDSKVKFVGLFQKLIEEIVYPIANEYFGDLKMKHKIVTSSSKDVLIRTTIENPKRRKNRTFIMEWFLKPKTDNSWIIYDVSVEDERWVPSFRSQFNDVIVDKSYNELINMMDKKLKEVKEERVVKDKKDLEKAKGSVEKKVVK